MNKITFPLKLNMKRDTVADLQDGLQLLLTEQVLSLSEADTLAFEETLKPERAQRRYGRVTRQLVKLFQQQHQLSPSGVVDEATANKLNDFLSRVDSAAKLRGQIESPVPVAFSAYRVEACYYRTQTGVRCLAPVTVDQLGRFTIPLTKGQFPDELPPYFIFRIYRGHRLIREYAGPEFWHNDRPDQPVILQLRLFDVVNSWPIEGQVVNKEDNAGLGDLRIVAKGGLTEPLEATSDETGRFVLDLHEQMLDDPAEEVQLSFRVFNERRQIKPVSGPAPWSSSTPKTKVKIVIDKLDLEPVYTVSGQITYANKKPAPGLTVQIYDKEFRAKTRLDKVITNEDGRYWFEYRPSQFQTTDAHYEKKTADLFLRIESDTPGSPAESEVYFNAGPKAIINLELPRSHFPVKTEFEEICACLSPFLKPLDFRTLDEDDIYFLAGETGIKANYLRYFYLSFAIIPNLADDERQVVAEIRNKLQDRDECDKGLVNQFFYAALRQNDSESFQTFLFGGASVVQPQNALAYILGLSETELEQAVERAIANFHIQMVVKEAWPPLLQLWAMLRGLRQLKAPRKYSGLTTTELLASIDVTDEAKQFAYIDLLIRHDEEGKHFFAAITDAKILNKEQIELLRFKLALEEMSYGDRDFAEFLLISLGAEGISSATALVKQLTKQNWLADLLRKYGVDYPKALPGAGAVEKFWAFFCLLGDYFPEEFIRHLLESKTLPGAEQMARADRERLAADIVTFLAKNPTFKVTKSVHQQDKRDDNGKRVLDTSGLTGDFDLMVLPYLEKVSRVAHITPRISEMTLLFELGLDSAHKIYLKGRPAFVKALEGKLNANRAQQLYQTAEAIAQTTVSVYVDQATTDIAATARPQPDFSHEFPAWENLFGSISSCACADCDSTLSPAAYLVSLLDFLNSADCFAAGALEALFKRRPDIRHIHLNCENTKTELPYIDLVNELLEERVHPLYEHHKRQTTRPSAALAVMPEYINRKAYATLAKVERPAPPPFDLAIEECRAYLRGLGLERLSLTETFLPLLTESELFAHPDWAIEKLAINKKEYDLLSLDEADIWPVLDQVTAGKPLTKLRIFLILTGLNSREAYTLFDLKYINPGDKFGIKSSNPDDDCDLDQLVIEATGGQAADLPSLFRRIFRLLRLKRITGWHFYELDEYLMGSGGNLDLQEVAQLIELKGRLNLSTYQVLSLFYPFSDQAYTDYSQDRLKAVPSYVQRAFSTLKKDEASRPLVIDFQTSLADQTDLILSGCGISGYELDQMIAHRGNSIQRDQKLTPKILSYFYRFGLLLRALDLTIDDYFVYHDLFGQDPFTKYNDPDPDQSAKGTPANALEFVRLVRFCKSIGLEAADLSFILKGDAPVTYPKIKSNGEISTFFAEIESRVDDIYAEEIPLGPLRGKHLLTDEIVALLKAGLDESLTIDLRNFIGTLSESYQSLIDAYPWLKFTHREADQAVADLDAIVDKEGRYHYMVRHLVAWNSTMDMLSEQLATEFGIEQTSCRRLLRQDFFQTPEQSLIYRTIQQTDTNLFSARQAKYKAFRKAALVIEKLALSEALLDLVLSISRNRSEKTFGELLGCYDFTGCLSDHANSGEAAYKGSLSELENLFNLQFLQNTHQTPDINIVGVLKPLLIYDIEAALPQFVTKTRLRRSFYRSYATLLAWNEADLSYLLGVEGATANWGDFGLNIPLPLPYPAEADNNTTAQDTRLLIPLLTKLTSLRNFAAIHPFSIAQLHDWVSNDEGKLAESAKSTYQAFEGDLSDAVWHKKAVEIRNQLREKQRDALVAYLRTKDGLAKPEDLYAKMLLDVEMGPCRNTSRIKSAISSSQLFITRILLNLEEIKPVPAVEAQSPAKASLKWQWMKQYLIWKKKQKVFYFPENYIVPSLLDTKTPLLKTLEDDLLKNELTELNAQEAFITYLEGLGQIARLQICGLYEEIKPNRERILHVFGRTWGKPYTYFYRMQDPCGIWTAWEKVEADLEGEQLIPIVYNNRMYVFWPEISQKMDDVGDILINSVISGLTKFIKLMVDVTHMGFQFINSFTDAVEQGSEFITKNLLKGVRNVAKSIKEMAEKIPGIGPGVAEDIDNLVRPITTIINGLDSNIDDLSFDASGFEALFEEFIAFGDDFIQSYIEYYYDLIPKKRWQVKLAWCEERQGKWSAKKISAAALEYEDALGALFGSGGKSFVFNGKVTGDDLKKIEIACFARDFIVNIGSQPAMLSLENRLIGNFILENRLSPLRANQKITKFDSLAVLQQMTGGVIAGIRAEANKLQALVSGHPVSESDQAGTLVRRKMDTVFSNSTLTPYQDSFGFYQDFLGNNQPQFWFQLITPHQYALPSGSAQAYFHPFFYQDARNSYLVEASNLTPTALVASLQTFKHPYVSYFVSVIDSLNLAGFYSLETQNRVNNDPKLALQPETVDFSLDGSYAQYNWELFFHIPFIIADRLRQDQSYEQALKWLNFIFDPTISHNSAADSNATPVSKYWITKPFFETTSEAYQAAGIRDIFKDGDSPAKKELQCLMDKLVEDPFNAHLIARHRTPAYQKAVVMLYIDILIEWGDHLFRQYTIETITEAFSHYYTALTLLGPRPEILPPQPKTDKSYHTLAAPDPTTSHTNHLEVLESMLPGSGRYATTLAQNGKTKAEIFLHSHCLRLDRDRGDNDPAPSDSPDKEQNVEIIRSLAKGYFCLPYNKKLHAYWDTLEDRMYKIRNCLNIDGELQTLALFQAEINPELLVKIATQSGNFNETSPILNMPPAQYRFAYVLQRAFELCGELKSLGSALLSAIEKRDGEALALLRNTHEAKMLDRVYEIRELQLTEASLSLQSLEKQAKILARRKKFYEDNLANPINIFEASQLGLNAASITLQAMASSTKLAAAASFLAPTLKGGFVTTIGAIFGGENIGASAKEGAESLSVFSGILNSVGSMIGTMGSYERRMQEWQLQDDVLTLELENLALQIKSADRRLEVAQKELDNQTLLKEQNNEIRDYMQDKFSNEALYNWQVNEISKIFFQTYQLAFDLARQAEQAYQIEIGVKDSNYVQYGHWDSLKKGLLSGERLFADLKELEIAYMQRNTRKPELSKTISLKMLDPTALLTLKLTGSCSFKIPEYIFDLDHPGHYFRQIKSLSISIPCVVGPYTGVHAKLTLESHETRQNNNVNGEYKKQDSDDRFIANAIGVNTIATSSAQNDSGMFEFNLRDERYLPFEGAGVISEWTLDLPPKFRQFDYNSISDVLLHLNYTARDGGQGFRTAVINALDTLFDLNHSQPLTRMFSLKHDFPTEWHQFVTGDGNFEAKIKKEYFPYFVQAGDIILNEIKLCTLKDDALLSDTANGLDVEALTTALQAHNEFEITLMEDALLKRDKNAQIFLVVEYAVQ